MRCHSGSISASVMPSRGAVVGVDGSRIAPSAPSRPSRRCVIAARAAAAASTWRGCEEWYHNTCSHRSKRG